MGGTHHVDILPIFLESLNTAASGLETFAHAALHHIALRRCLHLADFLAPGAEHQLQRLGQLLPDEVALLGVADNAGRGAVATHDDVAFAGTTREDIVRSHRHLVVRGIVDSDKLLSHLAGLGTGNGIGLSSQHEAKQHSHERSKSLHFS